MKELEPTVVNSNVKGKMLLIAPFRYGVVGHGVYRGAYPTVRNHRFLKRLRLRTLVSLVRKDPVDSLCSFIEEESISYHHVCVDTCRDEVTIGNSDLIRLLELVIDESAHPLYLHCMDGRNTTGVVIMCLRKLQNWNFAVILSEFARYSGGKATRALQQHVESFHAAIRVPQRIPMWLWGGSPERGLVAASPAFTLHVGGLSPRAREAQRLAARKQRTLDALTNSTDDSSLIDGTADALLPAAAAGLIATVHPNVSSEPSLDASASIDGASSSSVLSSSSSSATSSSSSLQVDMAATRLLADESRALSNALSRPSSSLSTSASASPVLSSLNLSSSDSLEIESTKAIAASSSLLAVASSSSSSSSSNDMQLAHSPVATLKRALLASDSDSDDENAQLLHDFYEDQLRRSAPNSRLSRSLQALSLDV
jgi:tyrosine-protein phosphatase OCA6